MRSMDYQSWLGSATAWRVYKIQLSYWIKIVGIVAKFSYGFLLSFGFIFWGIVCGNIVWTRVWSTGRKAPIKKYGLIHNNFFTTPDAEGNGIS